MQNKNDATLAQPAFVPIKVTCTITPAEDSPPAAPESAVPSQLKGPEPPKSIESLLKSEVERRTEAVKTAAEKVLSKQSAVLSQIRAEEDPVSCCDDPAGKRIRAQIGRMSGYIARLHDINALHAAIEARLDKLAKRIVDP